MPYRKLHTNEVDISPELVQDLITQQCPQWAQLPLRYLESAGTDHVIYRLGADKLVRLPRIPSAAESLQRELQWLPMVAPHLPVPVPQPLYAGHATDDYPFGWAVYRWLEGETVRLDAVADNVELARDVAHFIEALRAVPTMDAPLSPRGGTLADRDVQTRQVLSAIPHLVDTNLALLVWEAALNAPPWDKPPVWIHGDLQAGNLLVKDGRLAAVIDFGLMGLGDPACDFQIGWNLFTEKSFATFLHAMRFWDTHTWARGRGWALSVGIIALPYYLESNPTLAAIARRAIDAAIRDYLARKR